MSTSGCKTCGAQFILKDGLCAVCWLKAKHPDADAELIEYLREVGPKATVEELLKNAGDIHYRDPVWHFHPHTGPRWIAAGTFEEVIAEARKHYKETHP